MRPRFPLGSFGPSDDFEPIGPPADVFRNLEKCKLTLTRTQSGKLTLLYELHGSIGHPFDEDDESHLDGALLDAGADAVSMAEQIIAIMRKGGAA